MPRPMLIHPTPMKLLNRTTPALKVLIPRAATPVSTSGVVSTVEMPVIVIVTMRSSAGSSDHLLPGIRLGYSSLGTKLQKIEMGFS